MQFGASYILDKLQIVDLVNVKKIGLSFAEFYIGDYWNDKLELELQLKAIREIIDSYDLFCVIHLAHLNSHLIVDLDEWTNYVDNIAEQIEIIGKLGLTNKIVFHGVFGGSEDPEEVARTEVFSTKIKAIKEWKTIAEKYKIELLLENTDENLKDLAKVFKEIPDLGFTFDIGHANILFANDDSKDSDEKINNMLKKFWKRIKHIHIHDNKGGISENADIHLPIGLGSIDFEKFFTRIVDLNYTNSVTLEIHAPKHHSIYIDSSFKVVQRILDEH